jgi:hypothetical protein
MDLDRLLGSTLFPERIAMSLFLFFFPNRKIEESDKGCGQFKMQTGGGVGGSKPPHISHFQSNSRK